MMKTTDHPAFAAFVPGFDFLQKLAQGQPAPLAQWVAPTLDPKALEQRIGELKAVQFWLEQNAAALKATLQALEVQKMTMATLQTMNTFGGAGATKGKADAATAAKAGLGALPADAMQYWGALTQQFQKIATDAMNDVGARAAAMQAGVAEATKAAGAAAASVAKAATPKASAAKSARRRKGSEGA